MKVEFDEIKGLTPNIWMEGREWMWMAKVWEILEKKGRTTYETKTEKLQVYMLAVSAATVYLDYNHIVFNEVKHYESLYEKLEAFISENELCFLYGRTRTDNLPDSARGALDVLENDSRTELMKILTQEMNQVDINVGLYYIAYASYFRTSQDKEKANKSVRGRQIDTYEDYWKMIQENRYDLAVGADFYDLIAGDDWLTSNAYPAESFEKES